MTLVVPGRRTDAEANPARVVKAAVTGVAGAQMPLRPERRLPAWPLAVPLVGLPVWWVLGLSLFIWPVVAAVMTAFLVLHGKIRVPVGFALWAAFMAWMVMSVVMIDEPGRVLGFGMRAAMYLAAGVVFLYVYNASRSNLPVRRVSGFMTVYWLFVVMAGLLAVAVPYGRIPTPLSYVIPASLQSNEFVGLLATVPFSQTSDVVEPRPAAPFPYTNTWGAAFVVLLPFVILTLTRTRSLWVRVGIVLALAVSTVPALATQNRGMILTLAVGLAYVGVRYAIQGRPGPLIGVLGVGLAAGLLAFMLPVSDGIAQRLESSSTTTDRLSLYAETAARAAESPWLGFGAPRPSETSDYLDSAGTNGQIWTVLFSHGFPGAFFYLAFCAWLIWKTFRQTPGSDKIWLHGVVVMGTLYLPFYGMWTANLMIFMVAGALALPGRGWTDRASNKFPEQSDQDDVKIGPIDDGGRSLVAPSALGPNGTAVT